jgi:poly(U)-specific endoribonuclease
MGALLSCLQNVSDAVADAQQPQKPQHPQQEQPTKAADFSALNLKSMSISDAVQECWKVDHNRLKPDIDYVLNVQKGKKPWWPEDKAVDPLFTRVNANVWKKPTFAAFVALLDNYQSNTGQAESMGDKERAEIDYFLDAVMETQPMQLCHAYCHAQQPENIPSDKAAFKKLLFRVWFELYRRERGGSLDSSGFEHVFVGEIRDDKISGFHNWIQFCIEEKKGTVDYRGYIKPKSKTNADTDSNDHVLTLQFHWKGVEKQIGSIFIGVSPEWEMSIYTICFLCGGEKNKLDLRTGSDIFEIEIVCHKMHRDRIGTTYPYVLSHHNS